MKKIILAAALFTPALVLAEPCFSPSPCEPTGPTELCIRDACQPVFYGWFNKFTVAESTLPNGYPIMGWAGPCLTGNCPDIKNQAFNDLRTNALRANRAQENH